MTITSHLPNGITCLNLLCGYFGIMLAFQGNLLAASLLIFLAGLFDFLDGFVARALNANSPIGKELDSLADVITFGVLPGMIVYKLSTIAANSGPNGFVFTSTIPWFAYLSGVIPVFSALRLAKFNIDTRQSDSFIGLPTPANAMFIASLPYIYLHPFIYTLNLSWICLAPVLIGILLSGLLVSEIPLMALKFKNFAWQPNKLKYLLIIISMVLIAILQFMAAPLMLICYIILSVMDKNNAKI